MTIELNTTTHISNQHNIDNPKKGSRLGRNISDSSIRQHFVESCSTEVFSSMCSERSNHNSENNLIQLMSPRTVLNGKRTEDSKKLIDILHRKVPSLEEKEATPRPQRSRSHLSLDSLSEGLLSHESYQEIKKIKTRKASSFNQHIFSSIHDSLLVAHLNTLDIKKIDLVVEKLVEKDVNAYLASNPSLYNKTTSEFDAIVLKIAHGVYKKLVDSDPLYQGLPLQQNLLHFKIVVARAILNQKTSYRSDKLDSLVFTIDQVLSKEATRGFTFYQSESITNHFTFFIYTLQREIKDEDIYSMFLKMFHPNRQVSEQLIDHCLHWMSVKSLPSLVKLVENQLRLFLHHDTAQNRIFEFKDEALHLFDRLKRVDQEQVARSYLMGQQLIYGVLQVNGEDVTTKGIKGNSKACQRKFFIRFLRLLYKCGLSKDRKKEHIEGEVDKFLSKQRGYVGQEILFLGSMGAWAICDEKLRQTFPLLFSSPYSTRLQQGSKCYIQVESEKKYSLLIEKKYWTYYLADPSNTESFAIEHKRPLMSIQVSWQVNYEAKRFWSYTISTPKVEKLKATDEEFRKLTQLLTIPFPVVGSEVVYTPSVSKAPKDINSKPRD